MKTLVQSQPVLIDVLLPKTEARSQEIVKNIILVLGFSILTALVAQISFCIGPVPITQKC